MIEAAVPLIDSPFDDLDAIRGRLVGPRPSLVAFDFDGTLTEIADDPAAPRLTDERRALLARIPAANRCLAIVSGRALPDVRSRVGVRDAIVIGNHGLEIEGPGLREQPAPELAERLAAVLEEAARALEQRTARDHVHIENKRWSATLHLRPRDDARLHSAVGKAIEGPLRSAGFELRSGKASWEILPAHSPDKGDALRRLIAALPGMSHRRTLYAGDDRTDEDAFRALGEAVTIRVGDAAAPTLARYRLNGPPDVYRLLESLLAGREVT